MKVNLILLAYFYWSLLWHAMFLHFPFLVVEVRGAIKRRKTSAMTTTHSTKIQPSQAILFKMREDAPPLNLTEETTPLFRQRRIILFILCDSVCHWQVNNHV